MLTLANGLSTCYRILSSFSLSILFSVSDLLGFGEKLIGSNLSDYQHFDFLQPGTHHPSIWAFPHWPLRASIESCAALCTFKVVCTVFVEYNLSSRTAPAVLVSKVSLPVISSTWCVTEAIWSKHLSPSTWPVFWLVQWCWGRWLTGRHTLPS